VVRSFLIATTAVLLAASCSGGSSSPEGAVTAATVGSTEQRGEKDMEVAGIGFQLPDGWAIRREGEGFVNPALCFEASSTPRSGIVQRAGSSAARTAVELRVVELQDAPGGPDTRPTAITLDMFDPPGAVEWSRGRLLAFRQRDRWIYLGVMVGADASSTTREQTQALVDSIHVRRSGRC
jgi:hypothetical protein